MGKKSSLTNVQRAQIVTLHDKGYTKMKIFEKLKCSKQLCIIQFPNTGQIELFVPENEADDPVKLQSMQHVFVRSVKSMQLYNATCSCAFTNELMQDSTSYTAF